MSHDESIIKFVEARLKSKIDPSDKRQPNGTWEPAFPLPSVKQEEEYIIKMLNRDKELGIY